MDAARLCRALLLDGVPWQRRAVTTSPPAGRWASGGGFVVTSAVLARGVYQQPLPQWPARGDVGAAQRGRPRVVCAGCGAGLQSRDTVAAGYLPSLKTLQDAERRAALVLARARDDAALPTGPHAGYDAAHNTFYGHGTVCQRCFQAKHYSRLIPATAAPAEAAAYAAALGTALRDDSLIVHVADIFDWHGTLLAGLRGGGGGGVLAAAAARGGSGRGGPHRATPRLLLVVNKVDLLPRDVSLTRLDVWVRAQANAAGLVGALAGVHLVSAKRGFGVRAVAADIAERKRGRSVFVVGAPNVGKSTLINAVLEEVWRPGAAARAVASAARAVASVADTGSASDGRGRGRGRGREHVVVLDDAELPPGYAPGDAFLGDVRALGAAVAQGRAGARAESDVDDGAPANAAGAAWAGAVSSADVLAAESRRRAAHRAAKPNEPATTDEVADEPTPALPSIPFTTSAMPGTTLGVIGAALDPHGHAYIFDTPGAVTSPAKQALLERLCVVAARDVVPEDRSVSRTYRLAPGRCVWLGGLVRLEYRNANPEAGMLFTVVTQLPSHAGSIDRAGDLWARHVDDVALLHPRSGELTQHWIIPAARAIDGVTPVPGIVSAAAQSLHWSGVRDVRPREKFSPERMKRRERRALFDIVLEGLGWVTVTPAEVVGMHERDDTVRGAVIDIHACDGVLTHLRDPLLPFDESGDAAMRWLA